MSIFIANSGFVANVVSSGTSASLHRVSLEHHDLAILDAAGRAGVLTLHAYRLVALIQEAGLIDDEHAGITGADEMLGSVSNQRIANRVGIPTRSAEQPLNAVGLLPPEELRQLPTVLAIHPAQQATEIAGGLRSEIVATKTGPCTTSHFIKLRRPSSHRSAIHANTTPCKPSMA